MSDLKERLKEQQFNFDGPEALARIEELTEVLEEVSRVYDGMEDGSGEMCPTLIKVRATLSSRPDR